MRAIYRHRSPGSEFDRWIGQGKLASGTCLVASFILGCQVINTVTVLVDQLPEDQFVDPPASPPSMASAQGSSDSLATDVLTPSVPIDAREAARNNIIREMVETERKYVQDLEIMQVRVLDSTPPAFSYIPYPAEILHCSSAKQHHLTGHDPSAFPWPQ